MKSLVAAFLILFDLTAPASLIAPPYNNSFSVKVVLPASGCEIIPKVLLRFIFLFKFIKQKQK
jgi:hypothetical protein